jgi:4-amino-4-deoxy-L-arabinose transferase-like glycosyltransferase
MDSLNNITTKKFWIFIAVLVPLYLTWTFDHSLWNPDETRDAGIASEMYRTGDFIVPKLNGEAFLEKPPLYYWSTALIYKLTGQVTAGTTRLPSALFGILGVLFTFFIGKKLFNERVGLFGASILALSTQYFRMSHFALMDVALAALVTGAFYFFLKGSKSLFLIFTILAFYAKGFLGIVLTGLVVSLYLLSEKKPMELIKVIGLGALLFSGLVLPWFYGLWKEGGMEFLKVFLIDNHWNRFFSDNADHTEHFWFFYFLSFPVDFLPWTILLFGQLRDLIKKPQKYIESKPRRFLLLWFFGLLGFFCMSSSKRSIYLLPIFPAAALLSAAWLDDIMQGRPNEKKIEKRIYVGLISLALLIASSSFILAPKLDQDKTFVPVCDFVKENVGDGVIMGYDMSEMERGVFNFYFKGLLLNPKNLDELDISMKANSEKGFCLIANRNKLKDLNDFLQGRVKVVYEYRPNKRTRSYLVYKNIESKSP